MLQARISLFLLLGLLCALVAIIFTKSESAFQKQLQRFSTTQLHMGMKVEIILYARDEAQAEQGFATVAHCFTENNKRLSDYLPESEVSRLSAAAPTAPDGVEVSAELWRVLQRALTLAQQSEGAFDPTIGPLTQSWRGSRRSQKLPDPVTLQAARDAVGYQKMILLEQHRVQLKVPHMRLDLGGIAVGVTVDEAIAALKKIGIESVLIDASGDIGCSAPPPNESAWRVGVAPLNPKAAPSQTLLLAHCAVTTSGDFFQHVTIDGVSYSHIIDPQTGWGMTSHTAATVIAPTCTDADGLATMLCLLGPERGKEFLQKFYPTADALWLVAPEELVPASSSSAEVKVHISNSSEMTVQPTMVSSKGFARWVDKPNLLHTK